MEFSMHRRSVLAAGSLAALGGAFLTRPARAESTTQMLVGFSAGGSTDIVARTLCPPLGQRLGQNIVVENRAGASGILAAHLLLRSPADGRHLMVAPQTSTIMAQILYPDRVKYDTVRDFTPLTDLGQSPLVLVVPSGSSIHSVADLVAQARKEPGRMTYGSGGVGTSLHIAGALLADAGRVKMLHVPYQGEAKAVIGLLSGQLSFMFSNIFVVLPYIKQGKLRALAVTGTDHSTHLPKVPTLSSQVPVTLDASTWYGLYAPKELPDKVANHIVSAVWAVMGSPKVSKQLAVMGITSSPNTPAQFKEFLRKELAAAKAAVAQAGIAVT
ncbi:Bug family tripartite tricarboxylate transporter substrate binding protein [Candidimonas nitroreducens]|nr:tripartite tricarboxylate transporter substrate binding protein [Candidimonas nitroreducens]